jgi:hypothetical protein
MNLASIQVVAKINLNGVDEPLQKAIDRNGTSSAAGRGRKVDALQRRREGFGEGVIEEALEADGTEGVQAEGEVGEGGRCGEEGLEGECGVVRQAARDEAEAREVFETVEI